MWAAFAFAKKKKKKGKKKPSDLDIVLTKTVNILTNNEIVKQTMFEQLSPKLYQCFWLNWMFIQWYG